MCEKIDKYPKKENRKIITISKAAQEDLLACLIPILKKEEDKETANDMNKETANDMNKEYQRLSEYLESLVNIRNSMREVRVNDRSIFFENYFYEVESRIIKELDELFKMIDSKRPKN